jgi:hypothetical protein
MEMSFLDLKDKLKPLCKGASLNDMYKLLYHICLLKYSKVEHLSKSFPRAFKVATENKLKSLCSLEIINERQGIYTANKLTHTLLKKVKINKRNVNLELLPSLPQGYGGINEINNTDVFVNVLNLDSYYSLLYPSFDYVRPDALLVLKKDSKYKLIFLEIEASKSNMDNWLDGKKYNYLRLAKDITVYNKWCALAKMLNLTVPEPKDFKFTIGIIGKEKKVWGDCFVFTSDLNVFV